MANRPKIHYHIRWLSSGSLDWEQHKTREEAEESAKRLLREGGKHIVEPFDETCDVCKPLAVSAHR